MSRLYVYDVTHDRSGMPLMSLVKEIVYCKDCKFYSHNNTTRLIDCSKGLLGVKEDNFCSLGEKNVE